MPQEESLTSLEETPESYESVGDEDTVYSPEPIPVPGPEPTPAQSKPGMQRMSTLNARARKELPYDVYHLLVLVATAISQDGILVEEACILAGADPVVFMKFADEYPIIHEVLRIKELEYKHSLLRTLARRARKGDDKIALWLLERRYPKEFGVSRKKEGDSGEESLLEAAMNMAQIGGDKDKLIQKKKRSAKSLDRKLERQRLFLQ